MRKSILIAAMCVLSGPAFADRAQALQLLVDNLVGLGGSQSQSTQIARCFVDRMTDAQAAGFVAARTSAEREQVVQSISDKDGASACVQQAMSG